LQVVVDKFESTSERTSGKPMPLENVYAILPGSDPKLAKTIFIVSGHFDSRPSNVMDPEADAPGADDDASGVAVSVECARLLSKAGQAGAGRIARRYFLRRFPGRSKDCSEPRTLLSGRSSRVTPLAECWTTTSWGPIRLRGAGRIA